MTSELSSSVNVRSEASSVESGDLIQYVTMKIDGQLFGLPIDRVHDVFMPEAVTFVPMSHDAIAGVLNLRGRIVTAIDMRCLLGLPVQSRSNPLMAVGIEARGESYGLIIDAVGEVLDLPTHSKEPNPANLDERWRNIAAGIHRLEGQLLVILDVDRVLAVLAGIKTAA